MIPTTDHACIPSTGGVVTAVENKIHHTERCIGTSDVTFLFQNKKKQGPEKGRLHLHRPTVIQRRDFNVLLPEPILHRSAYQNQ